MKTNHLGLNLLYLQSRSPMFDNYYEISRVGELWLLRLSFFLHHPYLAFLSFQSMFWSSNFVLIN